MGRWNAVKLQQKVDEALQLAEPFLTKVQADDVWGYFGQNEWGLGVHFLIYGLKQQNRPIPRRLHQLLCEVVPELGADVGEDPTELPIAP